MKAYAECQRDMEGRLGIVQVQNNEVATPGDSNPYLQDLETGLFPVIVSVPFRSGHKLLPSIWPGVAEQHESKSLRELAKEYGVSHEAVRRTIMKNSRGGH